MAELEFQCGFSNYTIHVPSLSLCHFYLQIGSYRLCCIKFKFSQLENSTHLKIKQMILMFRNYNLIQSQSKPNANMQSQHPPPLKKCLSRTWHSWAKKCALTPYSNASMICLTIIPPLLSPIYYFFSLCITYLFFPPGMRS